MRAILLAVTWPLALAAPASAFADPPAQAAAADKPAAEKPAADGPKVGKVVAVPYRLTDTKHVLVRVKLNGKGPFNFILDTGAPAVFLTKAVAKKVGLEPDKKGWGEFASFEIEGGLKVAKATGRVEDLFQLDGMNSLGLAGVELHGVIGYNVLARFRITYDFTADKLAVVPLDFDPPAVKGLGGRDGGGQGSLEILGPVMKTLAGFLGVKPNFTSKASGFLGAEFEPAEKGVPTLVVKAVLKGSPADDGGLKAGDRIESVKRGSQESESKLAQAIAKAAVGDKVEVVVSRGGEKKTLTLELGRGL